MENVTVHPLVLLSVVDHYNRVAKNTKKRVVGVLLGQPGKTINVSNSFALPFEEDEKDPSVWFLDHDYLESLFGMFRKINAKETIVGWYHTGPKLKTCDLEINRLMEKFTPQPVLVIINVQPSNQIPTTSYYAVTEIHNDGTPVTTSFTHLPTTIEAEEAEEIGVEQLLRDIKNSTVTSLSTSISSQIASLGSLQGQINDIHSYLQRVSEGVLPVNQKICYALQDMLNLLPIVDSKAVITTSNDQFGVLYLSSLVRSVVALHSLIENKIQNMDVEAGFKEIKEPTPIKVTAE